MNCHKNQHLLNFDDFGKIFNFWPNLEFCEDHLWVFKIVGNKQTQKTFFIKKTNACRLRFISLAMHQNDEWMRFFNLI